MGARVRDDVLLEDAAVACWLAVHPDLEPLKTRWEEHLEANRYGDLKAQRGLGLDVDRASLAWEMQQDRERLEQVAARRRPTSAGAP